MPSAAWAHEIGMRALSVLRPYAELILRGIKTAELAVGADADRRRDSANGPCLKSRRTTAPPTPPPRAWRASADAPAGSLPRRAARADRVGPVDARPLICGDPL